MAIKVSQAFQRTSANAIDESLTLTKAQMLAVNDNLQPSKYFTVCQDDGFIYLYDKSNESDPATGKFRKFEGGGSGASALADLTDVLLTSLANGQTLAWNSEESKWVNVNMPTGGSYTAGDGINISQENVISTDSLQEGDMDDIIDPLPSPVTEGHDLGDIEDVNITNPADGDVLKYNSATEKWENGEGSGDAELEESITTNLAVGAVPSGTTLTQGMSFTDVMKKLFITEIAPTITFSASGSGVKEVGTSVTPTLTLTISDVGTGTPASIKFYDGSTLLDTQAYVSGTNSYTFTMDAVTTTKTVKGVLEYKKSDDSTASIEKSATYTFVMASYYGAVTIAPTDKSGITALTKNVKNTKAQTATFTLSNQRSCYCYPASFGNLTSIKDANNFEYISSYTKTTVAVDGVDYNVYTLTDSVTATGFKQVYA